MALPPRAFQAGGTAGAFAAALALARGSFFAGGSWDGTNKRDANMIAYRKQKSFNK